MMKPMFMVRTLSNNRKNNAKNAKFKPFLQFVETASSSAAEDFVLDLHSVKTTRY
jgi:hypothetical protein